MKNIKLFILVIFPVFLWQCTPKIAKVTGSPTNANKLSKAEKEAGWVLLFDGKTMDSWRNFQSKNINDGWSVKDGMITLDPSKKGKDIITKKVFENYEFRLEWKISECGNSGIIYNVAETDEYEWVWNTGPEMQILDNSCHPDAKIIKHRAGDLYDLISASEETVLPAGMWNEVRLVNNKGHVEHWLNGKKVVEFQMYNDQWAMMIANSKFKDMDSWGQYKSGHIALQDHGDRVWFRNIKIKEL